MLQEHSSAPRPGRPPSSPLRFLAVGETYFWEGKTANQISRRYHDLLPMRFTSRTIIRNGTIGARVTRTA